MVRHRTFDLLHQASTGDAQHAARLKHRPQAVDHCLHQRFMQIIRDVPAQYRIELVSAKNQIFGKEVFHVNRRLSIATRYKQSRIDRCRQHIFVVDLVTEVGEE